MNYIETLRNQYILECILKEYRKLGASVDVESKVNQIAVYLHFRGCFRIEIACYSNLSPLYYNW